jgi:hypothetical protein
VDYLGIGGLSVRLTNGADPEYTHAEHLGSPIAATDAPGRNLSDPSALCASG